MTSINVNGLGKVTVGRMAPMRGLALKARLARVVAPVLAEIMPLLAGGNIDLANVDVEKAAPMVGAALSHVDPDSLPDLVYQVLSTTSVTMHEGSGKKRVLVNVDLCDPGAIDRVFAENERALYTVIGFALKAHFADFIGGSAKDRDVPPTQTE